MSAVRLAVQLPAAAGRKVVDAAIAADRVGLDALWVGAVAGEPEASAATTTLLAGIAARTADLRLVAVLGAGGGVEHVHVAEELGVLDRATGGRVELVVRGATTARCNEFCGAVHGAWAGVELPDGRVVRVTPTPQQPVLPTAMLPAGECVVGRRVEILGRAPAWIHAPGDEAVGEITALARRLAGDAVTELVVPLTPHHELAATIRALATVLRPALAAGSYELDLVTGDAVRWHEEQTRERRAGGPRYAWTA